VNTGARIALATGVVAGLVVVGSVVFGGEGGRPESPTVAKGTRWTSAKQCKKCHAEVFAEWKGSHHQIAYQNPQVRELSDDFRNKECQACHLPRPVAVTGFGNRVLPRMTQPDEGVSCLTCHLAADGSIMGRRDLDGGCRPRRNEGYLSVGMCQSCHNQHKTTDEFRASHYAKNGGHCIDCHMPEVARGKGKGRGHEFLGAHDLATLRKAGKFEAGIEAGKLVLTLTNVGAGHNFPTEERHRAVDMDYRFVDGAGKASEWKRAYRFRNPYRDEPGPNTQLPADQSHSEQIAIPDGTAKAQVRLWYRLMPYASDDDPRSVLLFEREVAVQ